MKINLTYLVTICVLCSCIAHDDEMDFVFRERTQADWERVWHQESHSRCRERLVKHLVWACEKDIYKLTRRNSNLEKNDDDSLMKTNKRAESKNLEQMQLSYPWLPVDVALKMLRTRRRGRGHPSGSSITNECCTRQGCTWEEYAEYCPSNKRINRFK